MMPVTDSYSVFKFVLYCPVRYNEIAVCFIIEYVLNMKPVRTNDAKKLCDP